jgi:hypothetical protein
MQGRGVKLVPIVTGQPYGNAIKPEQHLSTIVGVLKVWLISWLMGWLMGILVGPGRKILLDWPVKY